MFITTKQLATRWGMSQISLRNQRKKFAHPDYYLIGNKARYLLKDVEDFERKMKVKRKTK